MRDKTDLNLAHACANTKNVGACVDGPKKYYSTAGSSVLQI